MLANAVHGDFHLHLIPEHLSHTLFISLEAGEEGWNWQLKASSWPFKSCLPGTIAAVQMTLLYVLGEPVLEGQQGGGA